MPGFVLRNATSDEDLGPVENGNVSNGSNWTESFTCPVDNTDPAQARMDFDSPSFSSLWAEFGYDIDVYWSMWES